jgi:hypothetical protein
MKHQTNNLAEDQFEDSPSATFEDLLDSSVGTGRLPPSFQINGARVGVVVGFTENGTVPLVTYSGQPGSAALPAPSVMNMSEELIGRRVVLMFEEADPKRPLIIGCLPDQHAEALPESLPSVEVDADGERFVLSARRQIVLRCGKASITLTCDGKILLQGTYVSNRSAGVMRIKGGTVHIN